MGRASIAALALLALSAGSASESWAQVPDPATDDQVLLAGPFRLWPFFRADVEYTDNLFQRSGLNPSDVQSATISKAMPALLIELPFSASRARLGAAVQYRQYSGVEVDDATFARMDGLQGDEAKAAGLAVAVDVVRRLRGVPGVAGVHIIAPGWEAEAVPRLVADAGLRSPGVSRDGGRAG